MTNRRQFLGRLPLLAAPALLGAAKTEPGDLVLTQAGSLPIVLTAPHGGNAPVPGIAPRNVAGKPSSGAASYVVDADTGTDRLAIGIAAQIKALTGHDVYLVVARFHRRYIDANRAPDIAFDNPAARACYAFYHDTIRDFVDRVRKAYPAGLLIDIHGQHKMRDSLLRGTSNGATVTRLVARAGVEAITGPRGLFGQLEQEGFRVFPTNDKPPTGRHEDGGFNGGYTVNRYGSQHHDGIDAVQLEFGSDYRRSTEMERTIHRAARAITAFYQAYLT